MKTSQLPHDAQSATPCATAHISAVVLTCNEEANIRVCLASISPLGCPIFVVDSGSSDGTREIAQSFGATVVYHPFSTHTEQWMWALDHLPIATDWVLALDADQAVTPQLAEEIRETLPLKGFNGLYIKRRQIFRGRWIKHGGYYPKYLLKLFRPAHVHFDPGDSVDHHFYIDGPTARLRHDLIETNRKEDDISFWIEKHNRYAALLAAEECSRIAGDSFADLQPVFFGSPHQRTLWLKRFWSRMPLFVRPALYFGYRYVLRAGFLDGKEGFIFHFLQAYWYRLVIDIKVDELRSRPQSPAAAD
jgi:glycosyltransferase involved in cell wall biosynthesis